MTTGMSEQEYVEHIKGVASRYLAKIEKDASAHAFLRSDEAMSWQITKENLSPFTTVRLCDAWLERKRAEEVAA